MWEPKLENSTTSSSQSAAAGAASIPNDKLLCTEDSGQIDSGFLSSEQILQSYSEDEDDDAFDNNQKQSKKASFDFKSPAPVAAATTISLDKQQQLESSSYLDSGLVEDDAAFVSGTGDDSEMLLERELDNGLAEWLCTLDLKSNNNNNSTAATAAHSNPINNLSRRVDMTTASSCPDQMNINHNGGEDQQLKAQILAMPEEEQPWEMCYKQDAEGDTYLHLAVAEGAEDIVRDLIKITPHSCLLDIQNDSLQSALHLGVLAANVRLVRMLLLAGAESSIRDKYGNTPLHLACAAGDLDCVRALTERITATEEATAVSCTGVLVPSKTAAKAASEEQKINRTHLVQYADVELRNYDGEQCVHIAASVTNQEKSQHVNVMRELVVRSGADVNAREGKAGYTALHMAVERGDKDLVKFLLDECAASVNLEVASYGRWTPYQIATVNRNQELMSLLRSKGAEVLDVSSSEDSDDSDLDDNEILEIYGAPSSTASFFHDRTVPCVGC